MQHEYFASVFVTQPLSISDDGENGSKMQTKRNGSFPHCLLGIFLIIIDLLSIFLIIIGL